MPYQLGQIVLLRFPFTLPDRDKRRPALVLLDTEDGDLLLARVTTHLYGTRHDIVLNDWKQAGLLKPSIVRLHKLASLDSNLVEKSLGTLASSDFEVVRERWPRLLDPGRAG